MESELSSLVAQTVTYLPATQGPWFGPQVRKIPWRRDWLPAPVFLPGEFHRQKNLVGYSPWDCKDSNMTGQLTLSHFFFPHCNKVYVKGYLPQTKD